MCSADRVAGPDHARRTGVLDLPFEQAGKESFGLLAVAAANFKMTDWVRHNGRNSTNRPSSGLPLRSLDDTIFLRVP